MKESVEKLLRPISESQPCGKDLSNDPRLDALENLLKGKPEVDLGNVKTPAEAPNWTDLRDQATDFFQESKHLRVAMILACSWLKTGGLSGFRDGLELIQGLLEQQWPKVYPLLDPTDDNDPTQRINILRGLTEQRGMVSGWLTIVEYLYVAPICAPKGLPPVTYEQLHMLQGQAASGSASPGAVAVENAVRSVESAQLVAVAETLSHALAAVEKIDGFLTTTLGASNAISFEVLTTTLEGMTSALKPFLPRDPSATGEDVGEGDGSGSGKALMITGNVRSQKDVVRAIDAICAYYDQVEPSSPVPYILRRAQKMARMNFIEAVQELNIATLDTLKPSMGSGLGESPPPATPPAA